MASKKEQLPIIEPKTAWVGDEDAPVSLELWGEYENEACAKAHDIVTKLLAEYDGKVRFNFRHFPLTQIHQRSMKAAEASVAAVQEGKFWEMHNMLFKHRRQLGTVSLREYAKEIGMTNKNLLAELVDSRYGWNVRADLLEGLNKRGVRTVPAFFINNQRYEGKISFAELGKAIEAALPAKRKRA
jgi:protein-disulfide isomerase